METTQNINGLTIRRLGPGDEAAVERLAERDSELRPRGELMGIEVEGRLLAAASIETGETIADPFVRTAELRTLLEVRIDQMKGRGERRSKRLGRRSRVPGTLGASPPGAGGKLLTLPVRMS